MIELSNHYDSNEKEQILIERPQTNFELLSLSLMH